MEKVKTDLLHSKRTRRIYTILIRIVVVLALILGIAFAYLRTLGVPGPLLRMVLRRANEAGIPVDVSLIKLTLLGWRADDVRYFSKNPRDTQPIFHADQVYFKRDRIIQKDRSEDVKLDIEAMGVRISPSVEWGIEIPEQSLTRSIERIKLSLAFLPDRTELSDGTMYWLGSTFSVNGTVVKATAETIERRGAKPKSKAKPKAQPRAKAAHETPEGEDLSEHYTQGQNDDIPF